MCIQPLGLHLCGTAVEWTAWATIALAVVAAISIIVNGFLAWSTHTSARSAKDQVGLERRQLDLFERQLALMAREPAPLRPSSDFLGLAEHRARRGHESRDGQRGERSIRARGRRTGNAV